MLTESPQALLQITEAFLSGKIDALVFERRFFDEWGRQDREMMTELEYEILNEFFWAVEDFVADPDLRDSPDDLDEAQLRAAAIHALQALRALDAQTNPQAGK